MAVFVVGAGAVFSGLMLVLALLCRGSGADKLLLDTQGVNIVTYTLVNLPQVLIDGVTLGFVYAAIALGYTMVYGVLEFINFAHSEIFAIGAFAGVEFLIAMDKLGLLAGRRAHGLLPLPDPGPRRLHGRRGRHRHARRAHGLPAPARRAQARAPHLGDRRILRPAGHHPPRREPHDGAVLPGHPDLRQLRQAPAPVQHPARAQDSTLVDIQVKSIVVIGAAVLMLVLLNYIVNATKIGKAIRSVAQDRNTAALMGIGVNAIISFTFLIGGALGGAAGLLYALKFTRIDPFVGFMPGIKAFTAAVLGGIGNLTGALLGGIVLGMLESFAGAYLGTFTMGAFGSEYKDIIAFLVLIIFIIFRPSGLLGEQVSQKA